jgi:membrane-bound lytic murein transglycosylase B
MRPFLLLSLFLFGLPLATHAAPPEYRQGIADFVEEMAGQGMDRRRVSALLGQAQYRQSIIDAITKPAEAKPWHQYRTIFLNRERIEGGVAYWRQHQGLVSAAAERFGVAPEMIVAIIGIETRYGGFMGKHSVLDALTTLAFCYPRRAPFFRKELAEFLRLVEEERLDPLTLKGSYAGAMGKGQFMPSSYRAYAVDFDADGQRDLFANEADIIGSVANYFARHNWRKGEPITARALADERHDRFVAAGSKPSFTLEELERAGITIGIAAPAQAPVALLRLEGAAGPEYWVGFSNFYAITRYNTSSLYAMAAYQLSQEILALWQEQADARS